VSLADRLASLQRRIERAALAAGRDPGEVTIVAVSKTFGVEVVAEALAAGVTDLGENRAQEMKEKAARLGTSARWHFVGHLQTNKVRAVAGLAALIHSVDRTELAEALARRAQALKEGQDVLIQVNVAGEPNKHGVEPAAAVALALEVAGMPGLRVRGLMTIPPWPEAPEESRPHYKKLAELGRALRSELPDASELSMGMSRDVEVAVEQGATLVRVGEALFGPRAGAAGPGDADRDRQSRYSRQQ